MFAGQTFLVSPHASSLTVAALTQRGGRVIYDVPPSSSSSSQSLTCVIVAQHSAPLPPLPSPEPFVAAATTLAVTSTTTPSLVHHGNSWAVGNGLSRQTEAYVRAARVPVVYERWVHECLCGLRSPLSPIRGAGPQVVAFDPFLFEGVTFTTTQLPLQLKANVVALLQFYGAEYHRHLLETTNTLVYSHVRLARGATVLHVSTPPSPPTPAAAAIAAVGETGATLPDTTDGLQTPPRRPNAAPLAVAVDSPTPLLSSPSSIGSAAAVVAAAASTSPSQEAAAPERHDAAEGQSKLAVAQARGLRCVTPQWVQQCVNAGVLLSPQQQQQQQLLGSVPPAAVDGTGDVTAAEANGGKGGNDQAEGSDAYLDMDMWVSDALGETQREVTTSENTVAALGCSAPAPPCTVNGVSDDDQSTQAVSATVSRKRVMRDEDPEVRAALRFAARLPAVVDSRSRRRRRTAYT